MFMDGKFELLILQVDGIKMDNYFIKIIWKIFQI
jgi:hypothetical protein